MKSGWWTEAKSIEEKKLTGMWDAEAAAGRNARDAVEKSRLNHITRHENRQRSTPLALQSRVSFTNGKWDELKVHDTVICTSYISSGKHFFKPALPENSAGTAGGSESEIAGSLVRDLWTAIEYGGMPEFLGRLRNRGHRIIARWGEEILFETSGIQKTWSSISAWEQ